MPLLFLLSVFAGGLFFHSEELFAETAQTSQITEVMASLTSSFQADEELVKKHDSALKTFLSDIKDCPYNNSLTHKIQSNLWWSTCDELIDKALKDQLSYFLLKKGIEESSFEEKGRRQAMRDSLQIAKEDKCQEAKSFLNSEPPYTEGAFWQCIQFDECSLANSINYILFLCKVNKEEEDELIDFLSSELKSCPLEGPQNFSCEALIKESRKVGLSYYQVRYAVQKAQKEIEEQQARAVVAEREQTSQKKQQVKKP